MKKFKHIFSVGFVTLHLVPMQQLFTWQFRQNLAAIWGLLRQRHVLLQSRVRLFLGWNYSLHFYWQDWWTTSLEALLQFYLFLNLNASLTPWWGYTGFKVLRNTGSCLSKTVSTKSACHLLEPLFWKGQPSWYSFQRANTISVNMLWRHGPSWLYTLEGTTPDSEFTMPEECTAEMKSKYMQFMVSLLQTVQQVLAKISSVRASAVLVICVEWQHNYVLRFVRVLKAKIQRDTADVPGTISLSAAEILEAEKLWIIESQILQEF